MKPRPYYTVLEKLAGESWKPQYGSYEKLDCLHEVEGYNNIYFRKSDRQMKIIKSGDTQEEIDQAVQAVNRAV